MVSGNIVQFRNAPEEGIRIDLETWAGRFMVD